MFTHAITRLPGENFADGITTANLGQPSYPLILEQHRLYRQALMSLGLDIVVLPPEAAFPDGYFVEDPVIITPKIAVLSHPGAAARQGEEITLEPILSYYRPVMRIDPPGTLDGGDVLMVGNHFFIGISERTNESGASQLAAYLNQAGHTTATVPVTESLHLKSNVNYVGKNTLLLTESLASQPIFTAYQKIIVEEDESYAANTLWVNDTLLVPSGFPKTRSKLAQLGLPIIELDVSEVHKMDGGLTCMSLRF